MSARLRPVLASLAIVSATLISAAGLAAPARVPVVVELFTSEGCSDCPPADALLAELDRTQPVPGALIIPLEEHVDYWDHQGWRDPFSSAAFTERQVDYARHFRISGPYTPQMVVAGQTEFVGSRSQKARAAIAAAAAVPSVGIDLDISGDAAPNGWLRADIRVNSYPANASENAEAYLAITEDGLASDVSAGENKGRHMEHRAVVRKLISAGKIKAGKPFATRVNERIAREWNGENLRVVVFLEGSSTGRILGAATATVGR